MANLWRRVKRYVLQNKETPKVDLKRELHLDNKKQRAEFAKDIMAIANTPGGDGFLIIGVDDTKHVDDSMPIVGFTTSEGEDSMFMKMIDALHDYCNPIPIIEYDEIEIPDMTASIGIVTIRRSDKRPHSFRRDCEIGQQNSIPIRRGTKTFYGPTHDELYEMISGQPMLPPAIVISLSGRSLSAEQIKQIEKKAYIEELIEFPVQFDDNSLLQSQIEHIIDQIGLTLEEWDSRYIIINPPGITTPALALMAYIHGLRGNFPDAIYIGRSGDNFEVKQQVQLQGIRDYARNIRSK